jgi:glycosyltransferase involved in cell wall biosynthesis
VTRRIASRATRTVLGAYVPVRTARWPDASRLFVVGDRLGWSIDDDSARLTAAARRLGYEVAPPAWARHANRQSVFHPEHFGALRPRWLDSSHKLGLSYFHGRPGTPGYPEFDEAFEALRGHATRVDRIQVTHDEMGELVLGAGVPAERVFKIPIGVDIGHFPLGDNGARNAARGELALPRDAFVVGSFQKDGVGLRAGLEPKLVKGPDTLVATLERLKDSLPELHVLLTGRARGYVRTELDRLGIPYVHHELASRDALARAYHALDVYVVTARQEGGPKAVLEAMATGVPLVTTRVGQVPEVVIHRDNGLVADVDDVDGLAASVQELHDDSQLATRLRDAARPTAEAFADAQLDDRWAALLDGFVSKKDADAD